MANAPASSSDKPAKTTASSSKKATTTKKSGNKSVVAPGDDVSAFEEKDSSETIQTLDGQKLEGVIQIIHEGVPEIWDVCPIISRIPIPVADMRSSLFAE